ncbi:MAG TPA: YbhN family protein [Actinomycetota bacterium]
MKDLESAATDAGAARPRRKPWVKLVQTAVSIAVAVLIFALIIPKIADYRVVWQTMKDLTPLELGGLVLATVFNLFTYYWQMMAAMPGLSTAKAAVNNQTGTTISNIVPAGGVIALGVVVEMFRSWGFSPTAIGLEISLTGIWNSFLKLGLPVIALAAVAATGHADPALLAPAIIGLVILAGCILLFALALWRKHFARSIGNGLGRGVSAVRKLFRKPPLTDWGERAVRFRHDAIDLVSRRWVPLTLTTVLSHFALYFILLLALRDVGVSNAEASWAEVLAVFSFGRLVTAIPLTPGGVGLVEVAYILGLTAVAKGHADVPYPELKAQITAAVLVFRTLTYGIQIPIGGFTYIIWRTKKSWLRPQRAEAATPAGAASAG